MNKNVKVKETPDAVDKNANKLHSSKQDIAITIQRPETNNILFAARYYVLLDLWHRLHAALQWPEPPSFVTATEDGPMRSPQSNREHEMPSLEPNTRTLRELAPPPCRTAIPKASIFRNDDSVQDIAMPFNIQKQIMASWSPNSRPVPLQSHKCNSAIPNSRTHGGESIGIGGGRKEKERLLRLAPGLTRDPVLPMVAGFFDIQASSNSPTKVHDMLRSKRDMKRCQFLGRHLTHSHPQRPRTAFPEVEKEKHTKIHGTTPSQKRKWAEEHGRIQDIFGRTLNQ
ncbi:hypothetical protein E6O75_ATG01724 [Venturia nashicola]|uniref:Uncharacterized protein n=1 Tax=Venturia nashicola TaxID=86259 RepID=A0A4Z1P0P6_9PEZI|nr:hypothetical protein E6O75_ATG01724 [Venturia nashicola]